MKIIFMGTPKFAVTLLSSLINKHEIVLVVTKEDSIDRKGKVIESDVSIYANTNNLTLLKPHDLILEKNNIIKYEADLIITAAYGMFLPNEIINHPKIAAINVHGSLLPKRRGAAPVQRAIMEGDNKTGISIIYMTDKMDAGNILYQKEVDIDINDSSDMMFEKLSFLAIECLEIVLKKLEKNEITMIVQDETKVTFSPVLKRVDELIDFGLDVLIVHNRIRGLESNPGAYTYLDKEIYKIHISKIVNYDFVDTPGKVIKINKDSFDVACKTGIIRIFELTPPGKRRMDVKSYLNGKNKISIGVNFKKEI